MRLPSLFALVLTLFSSAALLAIEPVDGAKNVPINPTLTWAAVPGAKAYEVYFGEAKPVFQCRVFKPAFLLETLGAGKTYHWRVDIVTEGGQTKLGDIQKFTTAANPDRDAMFAWSIRIAKSLHGLYPKPEDLKGWNYTEGMMLDGLYAIATRTGRDADFDYIRGWLDRFVNADGVIDEKAYPPKYYSLDRVRPGPVLLWIYGRTKDERYRKAADQLIHQLDEQPHTSDGGFWHRSTYPNQMWLDGIYMADVFAAQYAARLDQPKYFDMAVHQITTIYSHSYDPKSGLFYHGWDETKTRPWANKETGTSPEFWGRAVGWYGMAMADVLDWLPVDHPGRKKILPIFQAYCAAILKYQDRDTAMWFQILDKPTAPQNYTETSCSLMFAYVMARGVQRGWLDAEYLEHARRATRGVLNHQVELLPGDRMDIHGTVNVGTLAGEGGFYASYMKDKVVTNDNKSIGAFMFLSMTLSETANDTGPASREFPRWEP